MNVARDPSLVLRRVLTLRANATEAGIGSRIVDALKGAGISNVSIDLGFPGLRHISEPYPCVEVQRSHAMAYPFGPNDVLVKKTVNWEIAVFASSIPQCRETAALVRHCLMGIVSEISDDKNRITEDRDIQDPDPNWQAGLARQFLFATPYNHELTEEEKQLAQEAAIMEQSRQHCSKMAGTRISKLGWSKNRRFLIACGERNAFLFDDNYRIIWSFNCGSINCASVSDEGYGILATHLKSEEMGPQFRVGGHVYIVNPHGAVLMDHRTPAVAEVCVTNRNGALFVASTLLPDTSIYCWRRDSTLLWRYKVAKELRGEGHVGELFFTEDEKEIRVSVGESTFAQEYCFSLDLNGEVIDQREQN